MVPSEKPAPEPQMPPTSEPEQFPEDDLQPEQPESKENPFEKPKFDAGVEADEKTDPKKYIQQLTGKLSQVLRDYNETNDDSDTNKFVVNSLIPQAIPNMDQADATDVIDKVKDNIGKEGEEKQDNEPEIPDETTEQPNIEPENKEPEMQEESKDMTLDEIVDQLLWNRI